MSLESWGTPFSTAKNPSVWLLPELKGDSTLAAVVAPGGLAAYPKYLVHFTTVFSFTCEEESGASLLSGVPPRAGQCSFIWSGSPAIQAYAALKDVRSVGGGAPLRHYVIVGGDNIVGVLAACEPAIEIITKATRVIATHEV